MLLWYNSEVTDVNLGKRRHGKGACNPTLGKFGVQVLISDSWMKGP